MTVTLTGINPTQGTATTQVVATGTGFGPDVVISFTNEGSFTLPLDNCTYISPTQASGVIPPGHLSIGQVYSVEVTSGGSTALLSGVFTYLGASGGSGGSGSGPTAALALTAGATRQPATVALTGAPPLTNMVLQVVTPGGGTRNVPFTTDPNGDASFTFVPSTPGVATARVVMDTTSVVAGPVSTTVGPS
jgi:hypothetical protein